ncbi:MAG: endonuclease [Mariniphaga sp.]|nr:endonuclease [Mariniphaga sp.]MDD4225760.1 endonuclease [Mariniphaga sp.]
MNRIKTFLCYIFLFIVSETFPQTDTGEVHMIFYNTENLFDLTDDPGIADQEFTPHGDRRWTARRLNKKLLDISKVLINAAGWEPAQMIFLCEIENRNLLERLIQETPLNAYPYALIHKESPDTRGTDVAFLYHREHFYPINYKYFPVKTQEDSLLSTREILYVSGIIKGADTVHFFANHWPSRYGGLLESQPLRKLAAQTLRNQVHELQNRMPDPKIIITGDFNDQPSDKSMSTILNTKDIPIDGEVNPSTLYNLSIPWEGKEPGTLKYRSQWSVFDQIIVSGSLLQKKNNLCTRQEWAQIVQLPFLLEMDERYGGQRPKRTYSGYRYYGGISDHLPVMLKLRVTP